MRVSWLLPFIPALVVTALICPSTNGSQVTLVSGSTSYLMPVPANKKEFSILGPNQQLGCIQIGSKYSMCLPCNFPVNQLEVTHEAGICYFNVSGKAHYNKHDDGSLSISPPSQILNVGCGLAEQRLPQPPAVRDTRDSAVGSKQNSTCEIQQGSAVTLISDVGQYAINAPADKKTYNISGAQTDLNCINTNNQHDCQCCDQRYTSVSVDASLGSCYIGTDGRPPIRVSSTHGAYIFGGYRTVETVACGFPQAVEDNDGEPLNTTTMGQRDTSMVGTMAIPRATDPNCPASASWKVAINAADGNVYFAPVPLDKRFYPAQETHCLRLADTACVPCDQIGPAVGVSTSIKWGPCIFFFTDGRAGINTWYLDKNPNDENSQVTPISWFAPGAISGIECGTA